ncbi:hypothetical protein [Neobacillus niacini]|uniref:hypothetical protein n=1 Tax=Neobacillus niacini TaxID=86668 RepID=UPI0039831986
MKLNRINVLGWLIIIFLGICTFFLKEELSIFTTGLGGLICVIIGFTLAFYKLRKS